MSVIKFVRDDGKELDLGYPWGIVRDSLEGLAWPDVSSETEAYAFKDGSFWRKTQAEKRVISFEAVNRSPDVNYSIRDSIGRFFNYSSFYEMYIDFGNDKTAYMKGKITDFSIENGNNNSIVKFNLEFTSTNPFLQSVSDFGRDLNEVYAKIHYPRHYLRGKKKPYSVRAFSSSVNVINDGVVDTGFVLTVTFNEDTSSFTISNGKEKKMEINRSFIAGDILEIDTNDGVARLNGVKFYKGISIDSEFFTLSPGVNIISYGAQAGESTMAVNLYYRSQRVVF